MDSSREMREKGQERLIQPINIQCKNKHTMEKLKRTCCDHDINIIEGRNAVKGRVPWTFRTVVDYPHHGPFG